MTKVFGALVDTTGKSAFEDLIGGASDPLPLAIDVTTDQPAGGVPTTGVKLFAGKRANRRLPAWISPTGRTERVQPFLGSNDIILIDVPVGSTGYSAQGAIMAADIGTGTTPALAITNVLTMQARRVLSVAATVNLAMEARAAAAWCSRRLVGGGFHWTCRFGLETALPAAGRAFVGLNSSTAALTAGNEIMGAATVAIGLFKNAADTTLRFFAVDTAAASPQIIVLTNTGAVGWNVAGTMFQIEIFCAAGDAGFGYRVTRYTPNGALAPTVVFDDGYINSGVMPAIDTLFVPHVHFQNGSTTAAAASIAFIQMYKESD